jgi:putative endonuclease
MTNYKNTTLYIGVTNNLERRVYEHKNKLLKGFTEKYNLKKLVYYEIFGDIEYAILREKQLKKWLRQGKNKLITNANKEWKDLYLNHDQILTLPLVAEDDKIKLVDDHNKVKLADKDDKVKLVTENSSHVILNERSECKNLPVSSSVSEANVRIYKTINNGLKQ